MDPTGFFAYARERHSIYERRSQGLPRERWTDDPVLRSYRFCNIYRELDKTTIWFSRNVRRRLSVEPECLFATVAFRWFNRIETGEVLNDARLFDSWKSSEARRVCEAKGPPYVGGAYIIKTPDGMTKLDGVLWCIDRFGSAGTPLLPEWRAWGEEMLKRQGEFTLEKVWGWLRTFPFMGDFMAYEVVTDLRHTDLLCEAPDVLSWANPGPGAARGLCRILGKPLDHFNRGSKKDRSEMMVLMRELLGASQAEEFWPQHWPTWEMREVEHTLCEFDKYERARLGEGRPKQRF